MKLKITGGFRIILLYIAWLLASYIILPWYFYQNNYWWIILLGFIWSTIMNECYEIKQLLKNK